MEFQNKSKYKGSYALDCLPALALTHPPINGRTVEPDWTIINRRCDWRERHTKFTQKGEVSEPYSALALARTRPTNPFRLLLDSIRFTQGHRHQRHSSTPSLIFNRQDGKRPICSSCPTGNFFCPRSRLSKPHPARILESDTNTPSTKKIITSPGR